ncbi:nitroreductase family protein [Ruminiclostridium herbifermentans]|uniref:Nitroreductase family protein n=1 Tax=Ruminiclostridium herbifermentans TaxID=2488810 RepID=A0A7H1VTS7_9FIRM|nr:nitroreductase family protein [Ruminiclostridium herbifermentans]
MNSIFTRRSIRKYTNEAVPSSLIKNLLKAAMSAPSACNQQPWHFLVIDDRSTLDKLSTHNSGYSMLKEASLAILICGEIETAILKHFWAEDCAAATQNLLLAAHASGLGGVWLGVYPEENKGVFLKEVLNIPNHITPFSLISLGYPAETKEPEDRYNEDKIHYGKW